MISPDQARPQLVERYREFLPVDDAHARRLAGRGRDAARARAPPRRGARAARPVPQGRGPEPHRQLQGPGHGPGRRQGARGGRAERDLRLDRQHVRLGRRLRRRRRARVRRRPAGRQDRRRQAAPGPRVRRPRDLGATATSTTRCGSSARCPSRTSTRSRSSTPSTRSGSRARRRRRSRSATTSAGRPDILAIPVGNAGNISAYWRGFREYREAGRVRRRCRGCGASRPPARRRSSAARRWSTRRRSRPRSASATRRRGSWRSRARDESGGRIDAVTDDEILAAHRDLARLEGVFCEPSSAASVAGVAKAARAGEIDADATVVCVLTGNGLKDPTTAEAGVDRRRRRGRAQRRRRQPGARLVVGG